MHIVAFAQSERSIQQLVSSAVEDDSHVRESVVGIRSAIQKVLDNQALLVALFKEGTAPGRRDGWMDGWMDVDIFFLFRFAHWLCARRAGSLDIRDRLGTLRARMDQGFESVIASIKDAEAVWTAREFKAKLKTLTLAYDPLIEDMLSSTGDASDQSLSEFLKDDAHLAIMRADELSAWVDTFLPSAAQEAAMSRRGKLELMPYIVAMAYAVRVKLDAHLVKSSLLPKAKRGAYLQRILAVVDEFVRVLQRALLGVVSDTSLLDIAINCQQPLATYVTLITTLRVTADTMLAPEDAPPKDVALWDDGLADIRWRGESAAWMLPSAHSTYTYLCGTWRSQGDSPARRRAQRRGHHDSAHKRHREHMVGALCGRRLGSAGHARPAKSRPFPRASLRPGARPRRRFRRRR